MKVILKKKYLVSEKNSDVAYYLFAFTELNYINILVQLIF